MNLGADNTLLAIARNAEEAADEAIGDADDAEDAQG